MAVRIPTYERSVNLDSGAQTIPRYHAADDVGKALMRGGQDLMKIGERAKQQQERFENFQMAQRSAQAQQEVNKIILEEQMNYDPMRDKPGTMWKRALPRIQQVYNDLGANAPERLKPYYAEHANTAAAHADAMVSKAEVGIINATYTKQIDGQAGDAKRRLELNPDGFHAESKLLLDSIARSGLPPRVQDSMAQGYLQGLATSTVNGFNKQGRSNDAKAFIDTMQTMTVPQMSRDDGQDFTNDNSPRTATPKNAQIAMNFFQQKFMGMGQDPQEAKANAAAFVWNFQQESGKNINPSLVHDNGTGYGIAGFRDPQPGVGRRTSLFNFAGTNQPGLIPQLEYAWKELQGPENRTFQRVLNAQTPEQKAQAAIGYFRPRADYAANRASRAGEVRSLINSIPDAPDGGQQQAQQPQEGGARKVTVDPATGKMVIGQQQQQPDAVNVAAFTGKSLTDANPSAIPARASSTPPRANPGTWSLWADSMRASVDAAANKAAAKDTSMKMKLSQIVNSDIASISQTGKPVKLSPELAQYYGTDELSPELLDRTLGAGKMIDWIDRREDAQRLFAATDGMQNEPNEGIANRLDALMPKGGEQDYAARLKTYQAAEKMASDIFNRRMADPAAAADQLPEVKAALDKVRAEPGNKQAAQELTDARMKAQEYLGIPEAARSPITQNEAAQLAIPLLDKANADKNGAQDHIIRGLSQIVGNDPVLLQRALGTVVYQKGVTEAQSQELAQKMRAFVTPAPATPMSNTFKPYDGSYDGGSWIGNTLLADINVESDPRFASEKKQFILGKEQIDASHIARLRKDPSLKSEFDNVWGEGAAKWVFDQEKELGQQPADPARATGFYDSGTDPYQPASPATSSVPDINMPDDL